MASTLRDNLNKILREKEQKILPENIRQGVTILGVEGNIDVLDTSDANAVVSDLAEGKTAYVKGTKITGTLPITNGTYYVDTDVRVSKSAANETMSVNGMIISDRILKHASRVSVTADYDDVVSAIGLRADEIKQGVKYLNVEGTFESLDTSDANAVAGDLLKDRTAYVNGEKITGTLDTITDEIRMDASSVSMPIADGNIVTIAGTVDKTGILTDSLPVHINTTGDQIASAVGLTPDIIKAGTNVMGIEGIYGADDTTKNAIVQVPEGATSTSILSSLVSLDSLDTSSLTNASGLFSGASQLRSIPELDLGNVLNTDNMFRSCSNLISIPQLNLSKSGCLNSMFQGCTNLTRVNIIPPAAQNTSYENMFNGCVNLLEMPVINFATLFVPGTYSSCRNVTGMFDNCRSLTYATLGKAYISSRYGCTFTNMFRNCTNLQDFVGMQKRSHYYDFRQICTSMFENCYNLRTVSDIYFLGASLTNTFCNCYNLTTLTNVSFMGGTSGILQNNTFRNCYNLLYPPKYEAWDLEFVTESVFENCYNITFNSPIQIAYGGNNKCASVTNVFRDCHSITDLTLQVVSAQRNSVPSMSNLFTNCYNLVNVTINGFTNYIALTESFTGCNNLRCVNFINTKMNHYNLFRNSYVTSVLNSVLNNGVVEVERIMENNSYRDCYYLTEVGAVNMNIYNADNCFANCYNLTNLTGANFYYGGFMMNMFANCNKLTVLDCFSNWCPGTQMRISNMVYGCNNLHTMGAINLIKHNGTGYYLCPFGSYDAILNNTAPILHNLVNFGGFEGLGSGYVLTSANNAYAAPDIVGAPNLSYQSLLNITTNLANLYTVYNVAEGGTLAYPQLIRMEANQYAKLSEDDISAVQSKGWNIEVHTIGGEANG